MTARKIATPERICAMCQARTHVWAPEVNAWIPDATHAGKCPTRAHEKDAAA